MLSYTSIIFLLFVFYYYSVEANNRKKLNKLNSYLSNMETLNIEGALQVVRKLNFWPYHDFKIENKPILHYLCNLILKLRNSGGRVDQIASSVAEIIHLLIEKGAIDDEIGHSNLFFKIVSMRNLSLAELYINAVVKNVDLLNTQSILDYRDYLLRRDSLEAVYKYNCDAVKISKSILFASAVVGSNIEIPEGFDERIMLDSDRNIKDDQVQGLAVDMLNFISSAPLPSGGIFTFSGSELRQTSRSYRSLISRIAKFHLGNMLVRAGINVNSSLSPPDSVSSADLLSVLGELGLYMHQTLFVGFLKPLLSDDILESDWSLIFAEFTDVLCGVDENSRNLFHLLAHARMNEVIIDISDSLQNMFTKFPSRISENARQDFLSAFSQRDSRFHTPLSFAAVRYGRDSKTVRLLNSLYELIKSRDCDVTSTGDCVMNDISNDSLYLPQPYNNLSSRLSPREIYGILGVSMSDVNVLEEKWIENHKNNGNWDGEELNVETLPNMKADVTTCDIDVLYLPRALNPVEFYNLFVNRESPIMLRGYAAGTDIQSKLEKATFLNKYGNFSTKISTIPYADSFGQVSRKYQRMATFEDIANKPEVMLAPARGNTPVYYYAFTRPMPEWESVMRDDIEIPHFVKYSMIEHGSGLAENSNVGLQFYLGPAGSGSPVHFHGHAVNTLAFGMKHWFMYSPGVGFYSTNSALSFVKNDNRSAEAIQCVQHSGDVLYVPSLWSHAILNRKQSIGVAHEFSVESYCVD